MSLSNILKMYVLRTWEVKLPMFFVFIVGRYAGRHDCETAHFANHNALNRKWLPSCRLFLSGEMDKL